VENITKNTQECRLHKGDFYLEENLRGTVIQFQHTVCAMHSHTQRITKMKQRTNIFECPVVAAIWCVYQISKCTEAYSCPSLRNLLCMVSDSSLQLP